MDSNLSQKTGVGHNILAAEGANVYAGDLIISNLSSKDLGNFIKVFFKLITHRDFKSAEVYLASLKAISSLDDECISLINIFECKIKLSQNIEFELNRESYLDLIRSPRSSALIKDIVESVYIHFISISSETKARYIYENSTSKGSYTEEVFFEILALKSELSHQINQGIEDVYEHELCSYIRCALRIEEFLLAIQLSNNLNENYPCSNSQILLLIAVASKIHVNADGRQQWLLEHELQKELEDNINKCLELNQTVFDPRLAKIAAILLASTWFKNDALIDICLKNIEFAEKVVPEIRSYISGRNVNNFSNTEKILSNKDLSLNEEQFFKMSNAVFDGVIKSKDVEKWLAKGGTVVTSEKFVSDFIKIFLKSVACEPSSKLKKLEISAELDSFLSDFLSRVSTLNLSIVYQLCVNLNRIDLPLYTVQLLQSLLPNKPCVSPLLDVYLEALLISEKLETLNSVLTNVEGQEDSFRMLAVKIEKARISGELPQAIIIAKTALKKYEDSCFFWGLLLYLMHLSELGEDEVVDVIANIPKEMLERYSEEGLRLLYLIAKTDLPYAESIILEWFIDDPKRMAVNVTNLHLNNIVSDKVSAENSYPSDRCNHAIVYTSAGKEYTKLLVDNSEPSEYLLDVDSPLGQLLCNIAIGEEVRHGMHHYKVTEKLLPIIGAFRISMNIRNDLNSGNDCFYKFQIEGEGIDGLLEQIDYMSRQKQTVDAKIDGKPIPLLMRLQHSHDKDIVKGAFTYLFDRESNASFSLNSEGEVVDNAIVLDVLSLAYFSISGFCEALISSEIKIYITKETYSIVFDWLNQICHPDYMSIAKVEDGFVRSTAEDISKDRIIKDLRDLLTSSQIICPLVIDMPEDIMKIRDAVDISHFSSLKASISHSIPILCLDIVFCEFYKSLDVKLANSYRFIADLNLAKKNNKYYHAESHVQFGLQVPLSHQDVIELCSLKGNKQKTAAEILKMYPDSYPSSESALHVLTNCCVKSICSAYLGCSGRFDLSDWRYTEHIVYACCESAIRSLKGECSEQKLALLIFSVLESLKVAESVTKMAIVLFKRFAYGHFMDVSQINVELRNQIPKG